MRRRRLNLLRTAAIVWVSLTVVGVGAEPPHVETPHVETPLRVSSIGHRIEFGDASPTTLFFASAPEEPLNRLSDPSLFREDPMLRPGTDRPWELVSHVDGESIEEITAGWVSEPFAAPLPEEVMPIEAGKPPPAKEHMIGFELHRDGGTWLVGNGDDFGFYSIEAVSTMRIGRMEGWFSGYGVHFVGGPVQTDMPPRLFELFMGYRTIGHLNSRWSYDLTISPGIYTDFEGHAHQGWRIRGVGLAKYHWTPRSNFVFGVAYLDRGNLKLLPVGGLVIELSPFTTLELVFPEPRLSTRISFGLKDSQSQLYVRGQLGGGSWAIERDSLVNDIATYEDFRVFMGLSSESEEGKSTFFEVGYVFHRSLEFRSGFGDMPLQDTMMFRSGVRY